MKLDKFNQLKNTFEESNFEQSYKFANYTLYYSSIVGNIFVILFAYFFVSSFLTNIPKHFAGQEVILPIFVVLFLMMFELTKRFLFANVINGFLTKSVNFLVVISFIVVLSLTAVSFYLSMSGAKKYVSQDDSITLVSDSIVKLSQDSIVKLYNTKINDEKKQLDYYFTKRKIDKEQVNSVRERIVLLEKQQAEKLKEVQSETTGKLSSKKEESKKGQLVFLIISGFVEVIILLGVGFSKYYTYTSFLETKDKLETNPNFDKLNSYLDVLKIIYNNGKVKVNTQLPAFNQLKEIVNSGKVKKYNDGFLKEFITTLLYLEVLETNGKYRYIKINYVKALEKVKNHIVL